MGLEQGRLWGLRTSPDSAVILYAVETGLPTLFHRKKDAEIFQKRCKRIDVDVEIVELEIIEKQHSGE